MEPRAQLRADERASGVEAKVKSKSYAACLRVLCSTINMPDELIQTGIMKTRSANGLLQVLLPRPLKAKVVAVMRTRRMKSTSPRKPRTLEAQQLEITGIRKFEIAKLSETMNAQIHSAATKAAQNDGEAMVLCHESSPSHLTLLIPFTLRVRPFPSTTLANRICQGRQHHQRPFRCPCHSGSPATQDRTEKDRATPSEARSCWKESIH